MTLRAALAGRLAFPLGYQLGVGKLWPNAGVHDGISFNAASGLVVVKAPGGAPSVQSLTSAFTFTGGNQSYYRNKNGLLVPSVTNTPRVEYDSNGALLGLLMEASRTNICLQSEDLSAVAWTAERSTVSVNALAAPTGAQTADKLVEDSTASNTHARFQNIAFTTATPYTYSVFVKPAERTWCALQLPATAFTAATFAYFNLSGAGSVGSTSGSPTSTRIDAYPNGWYRCSISKVSTASVAGDCYLYMASGDGGAAYNGDGASGLYPWGFQVEAGGFASSYIPTTTVSVARTADVSTRTLGSEFSATAGAVVVAGRASAGQDASVLQDVWEINDTTAANRFLFFRPNASDAARFNVFVASVGQGPLDAAFVNATNYKAAMAWAANDLALSFNGGAVATDNVATLPTVTQLQFGNTLGAGQANGWIKSFDYYPTRLSNAQLQQLAA